MALQKVRGNFNQLFDKNLADLVRGIRNNRDNETAYIATSLQEIRDELKSDNLAAKSNAISKLIYLQMLGYNISWANFNMIEVMSSNRFTLKRTAYLAAAQSFHPTNELVMLTTNLIRKEILSANQYEASLALNALSCFINADLGRNLIDDVLNLLSSTKPYIRKKSVLLLYKIFVECPDFLQIAMTRFEQKLEDTDPNVQSACINVICELARDHAPSFLHLTPTLFRLMTTSSNNWMLIKVIKLFRTLIPLEPKIAKKLAQPLHNLLNNTSAMSLLYECINTEICLLSYARAYIDSEKILEMCARKLKLFVESIDQNLKYLGFVALAHLAENQPKTVAAAHKDCIVASLCDKDDSIRGRALDLLPTLVTKKNLMVLVANLMEQMETLTNSATYRDRLLQQIIKICAHNNYEHVTKFDWYVTILLELAQTESAKRLSRLVADQLQEIGVRVPGIREFLVAEMVAVLHQSVHRPIQTDILKAAIWICGEFRVCVRDPVALMRTVCMPMTSHASLELKYVLITCETKLLLSLLCRNDAGNNADILDICDSLNGQLNELAMLNDLEIRVRVGQLAPVIVAGRRLATAQSKDSIVCELKKMFADELEPVVPDAQRKIPFPGILNHIVDRAWPETETFATTLPTPPESIFDDYLATLDLAQMNDLTPELSSPQHKLYQQQQQQKQQQKPLNFEKRSQSTPKTNRSPNRTTSTHARAHNDPNYLKSNESADETVDLTTPQSSAPTKSTVNVLVTSVPLVVRGKRKSDRFITKENYLELDDDGNRPEELHVKPIVDVSERQLATEVTPAARTTSKSKKTKKDRSRKKLSKTVDDAGMVKEKKSTKADRNRANDDTDLLIELS